MTNPAPQPQRLDTLTGYAVLLGNIVKLITNPNLPVETGPGSIIARIGELVTFGQTLLIQGEGGAEEMNDLNAHVQQLVDEGRGPTPEEWAGWETRMSAADERFSRVREQLDAPQA